MALGRGGVYFSDEEPQPEISPIAQFGAIVSGYGLLGGALALASNTNVGEQGYTAYDLVQKTIRNAASKTPLGVGNTFRVPEFMSPFMSPKGLGLDIDQNRQIGSYVFDLDFFKQKETNLLMQDILGRDQYNLLSDRLLIDKESTEVVYEQALDRRGRGSLFLVDKKANTRQLLSDQVALQNLGYQADSYELLAGEVKHKVNPAYLGTIQSLDTPRKIEAAGGNVDRLFTRLDSETGEEIVSKFGLIPSVTGDISDMRARTAFLTSHLNFGLNRFNKLLQATANQVPFLGRKVAQVGDSLGLSLKTTPGPFYKQFLELGAKTTKIGAAYMGLETADHYRRNLGLVGHLGISAGLSMGGQYLYDRFSQGRGNLGNNRLAVGLFATQMLPGFSQGIKEGLATTATNIDIGRSYLGTVTGMSFYRRTIEGLFPGFTDPTVGAAVGLGLAAYSYFGKPLEKRPEEGTRFLPGSIRERIGFIPEIQSISTPESKSTFYKRSVYETLATDVDAGSIKDLHPLSGKLKDPTAKAAYLDKIKTHLGIDDIVSFDQLTKDQQKKVPGLIKAIKGDFAATAADANIAALDFSYKQQVLANKEYYNLSNLEGEIQRGATNVDLNSALIRRTEEIKGRYKDANGIGKMLLEKAELFGAQLYHSFYGASMSGETFDRAMKDMDVSLPFRRGGTLFAGGFLLHQLFTGSLFGTMETPGELIETYKGEKFVEVKTGRFWEAGGTPFKGLETSYLRPHMYHLMINRTEQKSVWGDDDSRFNPISKFFLKNFTYYLEEKNYYSRPYPITGSAFEDIPVIGSLLANTIGQIIKPSKLMHADEFMSKGPGGETLFMQEKEFGSPMESGSMGKPTTPYGGLKFLGDLQYQFRELEGLTGYAKNVFQKALTGKETLGTTYPVLASSRSMDSTILNYWDMELGGALFMSEPLRRLLPRPRSEIEEYNPIMNSMPSWLPDRFKTGDPYREIKMGSARLPGAGFAALNPELKNIDPEDYPDIFKYQILADVAPTSSELIRVRQSLFERRAAGMTTDYENRLMDRASENLQKRLSAIRDFEGHENQIRIPFVSDITRSLYGGTLSLTRHIAAPAEMLIPAGFRPIQKLLSENRSAIETYEYDRLYATPNAFWDKPIRDWIRPAFYSGLHMLGWDGKPGFVNERNEIDEHFDKLNFLKYMTLAQNAPNGNDRQRFLKLAAKTRYGVNPNGDAMSIYMTLPKEEQAYFNAFANAQGADRERILEMIPKDQIHLYEAVWSRKDKGENVSFYPDSKTQINEQHLMERFYELDGALEGPMPEPDWIGWHKDVDINDIKIKYIDSMGKDMNDYNAWNSQARRVARKPYLADSEMFMYEAPLRGRGAFNDVYRHINKYRNYDVSNIIIDEENTFQGTPTAHLQYNDDRQTDILRGLRRDAGIF